MKRKLGALGVALLVLAGCEQPQRSASSRDGALGDRYDRDRQSCNAQVNEYMRSRRNIDDSRRDVFRDEQQRVGTAQIQDQMASYGDSKRFDRMLGDCMESRGWPQPRKDWWQRIGEPHKF